MVLLCGLALAIMVSDEETLMSVDTHNVSPGRNPGVLLEQPQECNERPAESLLRDGGGAQVYF